MDKAAAEVDGRLPTSSGCALLLSLFTAGCMPVSLEEALAYQAPEGGGGPGGGGGRGGEARSGGTDGTDAGGGGGGDDVGSGGGGGGKECASGGGGAGANGSAAPNGGGGAPPPRPRLRRVINAALGGNLPLLDRMVTVPRLAPYGTPLREAITTGRLVFGFPWGAHLAPEVVPVQWDPGCVRCGSPFRTAAAGSPPPRPFNRAKPDLARCGSCKVATYCGRPCQAADWRDGGHRRVCRGWAALECRGNLEAHLPLPSAQDPDEVPGDWRRRLFGRLRAAGVAPSQLLLLVWPGAAYGWLTPVAAYRAKWRNPLPAAVIADAVAAGGGGGEDTLPVVSLTVPARVTVWTEGEGDVPQP
ncbi:hypothetical protein BU14_2048s0001 [Porphyra umbilicalis]|uniref:MYND-type domain-containing protein n=1 Tax=Porphyra umbilicalis TaxID=2786 RepID=A0A1X6NK21_PORUM|nr:hypothetical protein BU14_2048s0001 [Porphyra umbilicalis]|eukprot:OSX68954.1 hypothetical protein BU14_2048s0001 [Porphyra umbilicalis]